MKTLKIAFYDFKRLILNPITGIGLLVVLIACTIAGIFFKPEQAESLSLCYDTQNATSAYSSFYSSTNTEDTKLYLDNIIQDNLDIINAQLNSNDIKTFDNLKSNIMSVYNKIKNYENFPTATPPFTDNSQDISTTNSLKNFIDYYKNSEIFESTLYFTESDFAILENLYETLSLITPSNSDSEIRAMYDKVWENRQIFSTFESFEPLNWQVDSTTLKNYKTMYVDNVSSQLANIDNEIKKIYDTTEMDNIGQLILNYKNKVVNANNGLKAQLYLKLSNSLSNYSLFLGYETQEEADLRQQIAISNYILQDESLYYQEYLSPLSFNKASSTITAYDFAYFQMCLIGFLLIIASIYFTYKLFGQDRKNGKMDVVLSQNVTFSNVFNGKFIAITLSASFILLLYTVIFLLAGYLVYGFTFTPILAVFNLSSAYVINPILYLLIKYLCIILQVTFYVIITMFFMNISRKFEVMLGISLGVFALGFVCNIFLSGFFIYALFPFAHTDLFSYFGSGTSEIGFLNTMLISSGNFFISILYYFVITIAFYNFTSQLFRKN